MFNISEFKSRMGKYGGPAKTNLFEVIISPTNVRGEPIVFGVMPTDDLRFFCQTISVPGINLETSQYKPSGFGFPEFMPMTATNEPLNAIFLMDSNHRVMTFFHKWISSVVNVNGSRGPSENGLEPNLVEYKDRYAASELTIRHYSAYDTKRFYEFRYLGVYPTQVSSLDLSWATNDTPATLTVNFSYTRLIYQGFTATSFENSRNFFGSSFSVPKNLTQAQVISGFNQNLVDQFTNIPNIT